MRECIRRGVYGALLAGGLVAFGAGAASASDQAPTKEDGLLSGNGLGVSVEVPVAVDGNAVSIVGDSTSTGTATNGEATGGYAPEGDAGAGDAQGLLGTGGGVVTGNNTEATVAVPVNVGGNAVSGVGDSTAGTVANSGAAGGYAPESAPANNEVADGNDQGLLGTGDGIITGNTTDATVTAPVNVDGNAVSVVGDSATAGTPVDGGLVSGYPAENDVAVGDNQGLLGTDGIVNGNSTGATVTAPVGVAGNAVSVIGDSATGTATNGDHEADGDANEGDGAEGDHEGTDEAPADNNGHLGIGDEIITDNDTSIDAVVPVNVDGNAISIIGESNTGTATNGDHESDGDANEEDGAKDDEAEGDEADHEEADAVHGDGLLGISDGIITDNNTDATVTAPVNVDGNAVSIIGDSATGPGTATNGDHQTEGDANEEDATKEDEAEGDEADHEEADAVHGENNGLLNTGDGIITGNNTSVEAHLPVNVDGNAVSVIGDSNTGTATNGDHETDGDANEEDATKDDDTESDEADHEGTDAIFGDGLLGIGDGVLSGNNTDATATAPVNVDGNAVSVIGDSNTDTATNGDHETDGDANEEDGAKEGETDGDHDGTEGESKEDGAITGTGDAVNEDSDDTIGNGNANQGGASDDPGNADVGNRDDLVGATGNEDEVIDSGNASQGAVNVAFDAGVVGGNHDDGSAAAFQGGTEAEGDGFVASAGFSGGSGSDGSDVARESVSAGTSFLSSGGAGSEFEVINLSSAAEATPLADTGANTTWALMMGALLLLTGVASFRVRRVLIMTEVD